MTVSLLQLTHRSEQCECQGHDDDVVDDDDDWWWWWWCSGHRSWMRQLRRDIDAAVATRRCWSVSVQRMWSLSEDERTKSTTHQAKTTPRTSRFWLSFATCQWPVCWCRVGGQAWEGRGNHTQPTSWSWKASTAGSGVVPQENFYK